jgi:hypothetical protein
MGHPVLIKFPNPEAGILGVYPSLHDSIIKNAFKDGRNVVFRDQGASRMEGWRRAITGTSGTTFEIRGMGDLRRDHTVPARVLFYGSIATGEARLFTWSPTDTNGTTASTGVTLIVDYPHQTSNTLAPSFSFAQTTDGRMIMAMEGLAPRIWSNVTGGNHFPFLEKSDQFNGAAIVMPKGPFILALNTVGGTVPDASRAGKTTVHWSSRDAPEIWRPRANNSAGNLRIAELDSQIIAAAPIGDRIAIYSKDTMALLSFLGAPYYFGSQPALDSIGAISKHCVVAVGRFNFGISKKGIWRTDGVEFQWIDTPAVREFFFSQINRDQDSKTVGFHNQKIQQVIWYFPTGNSATNDLGLGYDYVRNAWTVYGFGRSFAIPERVFNRPIVATSTGQIHYLNQGSDDLSAPINAYVETPKMDFGDPLAVKSVQEVRLAVADLSGTLNLHVRAFNSLDDSAAYTGPYQITAGYSKIPVRETGRFFQMKISSSSTSNTWTVSQLEIRGRVSGVR